MPIFHLDIEAFLTTVERLEQPALASRPLVIAPPKPRSLVLAASEDAKKLGISRDMPLTFLRKHFPGVQVQPPNFPLYHKANQHVLTIVSEFSPIVEPVDYGHIAMDMTGMRQLYGDLETAALKLCRTLVKRAGLLATVGIASNKLVSTIAAKEIQKIKEPLYQVPQDKESHFLGPLACKVLPEWGEALVRKTLFELNLRRIEQIQALSRDLLSFAVGVLGSQLHRHAMGIDPTPVTPPANTPRLTNQHRFLPDTNDDDTLRAAVYQLTQELCFSLRAKNITASRARLELKYCDDVIRQRRFKFQPTQTEDAIYRNLMRSFNRLCDRRSRVRHLSLTLEGLTSHSHQKSLFPSSNENKLAPHLDQLRTRFGSNAVSLGKALKSSA